MPALLARSRVARLLTPLALLALCGSPLALARYEPATITAPAAAPHKAADYIRSAMDEDTGLTRMELAIHTFAVPGKDGQPRTVHLVSAIHIADKSFYDQMQTFLDQQDVVLFEGVKPPGAGTIDASATTEQRATLTKRRLDFLISLLKRHRTENATFPASLDELAAKSDVRFGPIIKGLITDAWGRTLTYSRTESKTDDAKATEMVTLTSAGPDGQTQDGGGDDIRLASKALVIGEAASGVSKQAGGIQQKLADALGLTYQLQGMDSHKPNWRSSDMSVDQVQDRITAAGGDADALFSMLDGSSFTGKMAGMLISLLKLSPRMATTAKIMMVQVMSEAESMMGSQGLAGAGKGASGALGGLSPTILKVIIEDRNAVVLADLRAILDNEPTIKSIAIFYGGGHMPDFETRLVKDFGATHTGEQWFTAITVDPKAAGIPIKEVKMMREMMKKQFERMTKQAEKTAAKP